MSNVIRIQDPEGKYHTIELTDKLLNKHPDLKAAIDRLKEQPMTDTYVDKYESGGGHDKSHDKSGGHSRGHSEY